MIDTKCNHEPSSTTVYSILLLQTMIVFFPCKIRRKQAFFADFVYDQAAVWSQLSK